MELRPILDHWCFPEDYVVNCHVTEEDRKRIDNYRMVRELLK